MKKTIYIIGIVLLFMAVLMVSVKADSEKFCTDSDYGKDIWTAGIA